MNLLITNFRLDVPSGTEMYVRDLALAVRKRGIGVEVYAPEIGPIGVQLRNAGINVASSTADLKVTPDVIHAHHFQSTVDLIVRFDDVPMIFFVHDRLSHYDVPPRHSRIMKYVAVDHNCIDRLLLDNQFPEQDTAVMYNWVDTDVFKLREKIADKPSRALVFSNYASGDNYFSTIREACESEGLNVEGIGFALGNSEFHPESLLGRHDIVFAKAKAAMEAMATGAHVVVCDSRGLAGTVNTENFDHFRKFNFGMKTLTRPVEKGAIVEEIRKYDPLKIRQVANLIRDAAPLTRSVDALVSLYTETIRRYKAEGPRPTTHDRQTIRDHFLLKSLAPAAAAALLRHIEATGRAAEAAPINQDGS